MTWFGNYSLFANSEGPREELHSGLHWARNLRFNCSSSEIRKNPFLWRDEPLWLPFRSEDATSIHITLKHARRLDEPASTDGYRVPDGGE